MRYVNSDLVHPCNPASFHAAQSDCLLLSVLVASSILMLACQTAYINLHDINHSPLNRQCTDVFQLRPIMAHNRKNTGYLIDIFLSLNLI